MELEDHPTVRRLSARGEDRRVIEETAVAVIARLIPLARI